MPTESMADHILASEHLVVARENPEKPFTLRATQTLKGSPEKVPAVDLFLDSSTRRLLALDPDRSVLCGWSPEQGEWRRIFLHEEPQASVIREIIARADSWRENPDERALYFSGLLGHEDTDLSDVAHIEVARIPYSKLLKFADRMPREELYERLRDFRRMEWHALYILFLAQSEDPRDHEFIRKELEDAARFGLSIQTAAWATALIEIDGTKGLERVRELYLEKPHRTRNPKELAAIHAALRVHADEGKPELRDTIVAAYGKLLEQHRALAPDLADDLTRWKRFDHAESFFGLLSEAELDFASTARIRSHLRSANAQTAAGSPATMNETEPDITTLLLVGSMILLPILIALRGGWKQAATT